MDEDAVTNAVQAMRTVTGDCDYVEYTLDIKNGVVVGCEFFGEGRQSEPLTEPMVYFPDHGAMEPIVSWRAFNRVARRIKRNLAKALKTPSARTTG